MTMTTSMQRSHIVIPAQGLIEVRDTLTDLLKEYGTEDNGEMWLFMRISYGNSVCLSVCLGVSHDPVPIQD